VFPGIDEAKGLGRFSVDGERIKEPSKDSNKRGAKREGVRWKRANRKEA
jgi:hypothetical protein